MEQMKYGKKIFNILGENRMKKTLGLELFFELKRAFGDIICYILWLMVIVASVLGGILWYVQYCELYSMAIKLIVSTVFMAIIGTISWFNVRNKVNDNLSSLTTDENDMLIYIYNRSQKIANAVYIPYDDAIAINLKYKRILRRYDTPIRVCRLIGTDNAKYCFLYGIRQIPKNFIEDGKIKDTNLPSAKLCDYLDKYQ